MQVLQELQRINKNVPISSAPLISSNCLENTVATINIKVVIIRYIFPKIELAIFNIIFEVGIIAEIYSDNKLDKLATEKAIAKETAISFNDISFFVQYVELPPLLSSPSVAIPHLFLKNNIEGIDIVTKKYTAITKLSATIVALVIFSGVLKAFVMATKLAPPPIYEPVIIPAISAICGISELSKNADINVPK